MKQNDVMPAPDPIPRTVQLQVRNSYGTERIYPKNLVAQLFCDLLERKTLVRRDLDHIHALGFEIQWIPLEIV